jgi:hypothetical protein
VARALFSFRGLILVFGLVAVVLPIALVGQLEIVRTLNAITQTVAEVREDEFLVSDVLQVQLEAELALREFAATREQAALDAYYHSRLLIPTQLRTVGASLAHMNAPGATLDAIRSMEETYASWLHDVAEPIVRGEPNTTERRTRGKMLLDRFSNEVVPVSRYLEQHYNALVTRRSAAIETTSRVALVAIGIIALELLAFAVVLTRLRRELDRERGVVETMQRATAGRLVVPHHLEIGTAYRSATRGARIGGDVYDVYRLDDDRTLLVVADVSGKGVTAAVETTFVRYALRALASQIRDVAEIVRQFDALYLAAAAAPEAFVSLFLGIHDRRDGTIAYANAGHEACWVRRDHTLEELAPTGPVIGIGALSFASATTRLGSGELLVLATDGLTEARDRDGGFVPAARVRTWIAEVDAATPQRFVDGVVAAVTRYVRGRISDDLALLAVEPK